MYRTIIAGCNGRERGRGAEHMHLPPAFFEVTV
jgi:hypothetical protein